WACDSPLMDKEGCRRASTIPRIRDDGEERSECEPERASQRSVVDQDAKPPWKSPTRSLSPLGCLPLFLGLLLLPPPAFSQAIHYSLAMPQPATHVFQVEVT